MSTVREKRELALASTQKAGQNERSGVFQTLGHRRGFLKTILPMHSLKSRGLMMYLQSHIECREARGRAMF